jgi:hypothetical protein
LRQLVVSFWWYPKMEPSRSARATRRTSCRSPPLRTSWALRRRCWTAQRSRRPAHTRSATQRAPVGPRRVCFSRVKCQRCIMILQRYAVGHVNGRRLRSAASWLCDRRSRVLTVHPLPVKSLTLLMPSTRLGAACPHHHQSSVEALCALVGWPVAIH